MSKEREQRAALRIARANNRFDELRESLPEGFHVGYIGNVGWIGDTHARKHARGMVTTDIVPAMESFGCSGIGFRSIDVALAKKQCLLNPLHMGPNTLLKRSAKMGFVHVQSV